MFFSQMNVLFLFFSDSPSGHMSSLIIPLISFYWLPNSILASENFDVHLHNNCPFLEICLFFLVIFLIVFTCFVTVVLCLPTTKENVFVFCED